MKNKFLLIALLVNATIAQAEYTRVNDYHFAPDTVHSWKSSSEYESLKNAPQALVNAHVRAVDANTFTHKVTTHIIATMFTSMICGAAANWWQDYKVYCAKKAKEIAQIKAETARIIAQG